MKCTLNIQYNVSESATVWEMILCWVNLVFLRLKKRKKVFPTKLHVTFCTYTNYGHLPDEFYVIFVCVCVILLL